MPRKMKTKTVVRIRMKHVLAVALAMMSAVGIAGAEEDLCRLDGAESFVFSAENPKGIRGGGDATPCCKDSQCIYIDPGATAVLAEVDGPGRLESFWFGAEFSSDYILRMYWDGESTPSVEAPLPAFFGYAYVENHLTVENRYPCLNSALMLTSPHVGCNCYFPMPFRRQAKVTVENRGAKRNCCFYTITGSRGQQPADIGYFHAQYRTARPVDKGKPYVILDGVRGRGQFIGMTMAVGVNGGERCWCEGEVRMFLDGEATPTVQYTGTEDYFCGSYQFGSETTRRQYQSYSGLYAGMYAVFGERGGTGGDQHRFLLYRWHVKDPIRFKKGCRVTIDALNVNRTPRQDDYTTVAYWYEAPES